MTPRTRAIHLWEQNSPLCFDREETLCLMHGIVVSTPHLYLIAMPCHSTMDDYAILHHHHTRQPRQLLTPDMLHIVHAVGTLAEFTNYLSASPYRTQFQFLAYQRRDYTLRRRPLSKILPTETDEQRTQDPHTTAASH